MNAPSPWSIALAQVSDLPPNPGKPSRFNPRPAGVMIEGSATVRVLKALREVFPNALPHHELIRRSGTTRGAAAWAICFLASRGLIEKLGHPGHSRYMRYRCKPEAEGESNGE